MDGLPKVRFKIAWQAYRVGDVIQPPATLRGWLVGNGFAELVEAESPIRPAKMARAAAAKVADASRKLFG